MCLDIIDFPVRILQVQCETEACSVRGVEVGGLVCCERTGAPVASDSELAGGEPGGEAFGYGVGDAVVGHGNADVEIGDPVLLHVELLPYFVHGTAAYAVVALPRSLILAVGVQGVGGGDEGELIGQRGTCCIFVAAIDIAIGGQYLKGEFGVYGIACLDDSSRCLLADEVAEHHRALSVAVDGHFLCGASCEQRQE